MCRLEFTDDFASRSRTQRLANILVDVFGDEPNAAVAQAELNPARMQAAEGVPCKSVGADGIERRTERSRKFMITLLSVRGSGVEVIPIAAFEISFSN